MLEDKRCVMTEWPRDRLNIDAFYHEIKIETAMYEQ